MRPPGGSHSRWSTSLARGQNLSNSRGPLQEVGVLRIPAYKVLGALIHIWEARGKPDDWAISSLRELAAVMGKGWAGPRARTLKASLKSLRDIPVQWIEFFSKKDGYIDILEDQPLRFIKIKFLTRKRKEEEIECKFRFKFDERIQENLLLGYTKPLRLDVISKLDDIATLLYCHVDLVMADKGTYVRRSESLFQFQDLGLTAKRYEHAYTRKAALEGAIEQLITIPKKEGNAGTPLSTGVLTDIFLTRTRDDRDWNVHFKKGLFRRAIPGKSQAQIEELVQEMGEILGTGKRNRGFYLKIARRLPADLIRTALRDTLDEELAGKLTGSRAQFFLLDPGPGILPGD